MTFHISMAGSFFCVSVGTMDRWPTDSLAQREAVKFGCGNFKGRVGCVEGVSEQECREIDKIMEGYQGARMSATRCPKCGTNDSVVRRELQTRRADEAMTQMYRCGRCSHQWRKGG